MADYQNPIMNEDYRVSRGTHGHIPSKGEQPCLILSGPGVLEGKELDIAFNSRFLSDALSKIREDFIDVKFSGATSPTIIVPKEGDKFLYMVLPIRMLG